MSGPRSMDPLSLRDAFNSLVQKSESLVAETDMFGMGNLLRGPEQLAEATLDLVAKAQARGPRGSIEVQETKANRLLSSEGFQSQPEKRANLLKMQRDCAKLELRDDGPWQELGDTDVEGFLKHHHDMIVCTAIDEAQTATIEQSRANLDRVSCEEWEEEKKRLLLMLGQGWGEWQPPQPQQARLGTASAAAAGRQLALSNAGVGAAGGVGAQTPRFPGRGGNVDGQVAGSVNTPFNAGGVTPMARAGTPGSVWSTNGFGATPGERRMSGTKRAGPALVSGRRSPLAGSDAAAGRSGAAMTRMGGGATAPAGPRTQAMSAHMRQFAAVVSEMNSVLGQLAAGGRSADAGFALAGRFRRQAANAQLDASGVDSTQSVNTWQLLVSLLHENGDDAAPGTPPLRAGAYASFQQRVPSLAAAAAAAGGAMGGGATTAAAKAEGKLLLGSLRFLESQFEDFVRTRAPSAGGVPDTLGAVLSYVASDEHLRALTQEPGSEEDVYAVLYLLLRCGKRGEAVRYLRERIKANQHIQEGVAVLTSLQRFAARLGGIGAGNDSGVPPAAAAAASAMPGAGTTALTVSSQPSQEDAFHRLRDLMLRLYPKLSKQQLQQGQGQGQLPARFKKAVLNLISHYNPRDSIGSALEPTVEDFIWYKISMILHSSGVAGGAAANPIRAVVDPSKAYTRLHLAKKVLKPAQRKAFTSAGRSPYVYFRVLLLCLEFEEAINYLTQTRRVLDAQRRGGGIGMRGGMQQQFGTQGARAGMGVNGRLGNGGMGIGMGANSSAAQLQSAYLCDPLHFALTLKHYGCLTTTSTGNLAALRPVAARAEADGYLVHMSDPTMGRATMGGGAAVAAVAEVKALNLERLVGDYITAFDRDEPALAAHYVATLRTAASDESGAPSRKLGDVAMQLMCGVILRGGDGNERHLDGLLGGVAADGATLPGVLKHAGLVDQTQYAVLVDMATRQAIQGGKATLACMLFIRAKRWGDLLSVLNHELGQVVLLPVGQQRRKQWRELTQKLLHRYISADGNGEDPRFRYMNELRACERLLHLCTFADLVNAEQWRPARELIDRLGLLPLTAEPSEMQEAVRRVDGLHAAIKRNLAHVVLGKMSCLERIYTEVKTVASLGRSVDGGATPGAVGRVASAPARKASQQKMVQLRQAGKALITFVGLIKYAIPDNINARLTMLEVRMS